MSELSYVDEDFIHNSEITWKKLQTARIKEGFVDGKYVGEESTVQNGFNDGYKVGFKTNFQIAVLKGVVGAIEINLKDIKSVYLQNAVELKNEIIKLEHFCLDAERNKVSRTCSTVNINSDGIDEILGDTINNHSADATNLKDDLKIVTNKLHSVKQKTLKLLHESGHTALSELINAI